MYCKKYGKKTQDQRLQASVTEQVSQYFALAAEDPSSTQNTSVVDSSREIW